MRGGVTRCGRRGDAQAAKPRTSKYLQKREAYTSAGTHDMANLSLPLSDCEIFFDSCSATLRIAYPRRTAPAVRRAGLGDAGATRAPAARLARVVRLEDVDDAEEVALVAVL